MRIAILLPAMLVALSSGRTPLLDLYLQALDLFASGDFAGASQVFTEMAGRMPDNGRLRFDLSASLFRDGSHAYADSLLQALRNPGTLEGDTLPSALSASLLAVSIDSSDRQGVELAVVRLRDLLADGDGSGDDITNLETALNWLENNPPDSSSSSGQQQDQQQDQQDQQQQQSQQQNQQQQSQQQQQQNQQQQNQQQQQQNQQQASGGGMEEGRMSEEQARMLLQLVEEAVPEDSTQGRPVSGGGPDW